MPEISINDLNLSYDDVGSGKETIIFAHGVLLNRTIFQNQIDTLKEHYRCIAFDFRGHGQSSATKGGYSMDSLADDVISFIETLGCSPCHFVGHSMGGFVALRVAIERPDLLRSLILISSSADREPPKNKVKYWGMTLVLLLTGGLRFIMKDVMEVMFGEIFRNDSERAAEREYWENHLLNIHRNVTQVVLQVLHRESVYQNLREIKTPVLILVGGEDKTTDETKATRMKDAFPKAELEVIPRSGHSPMVETPEMVNTALREFLTTVGGSSG